MKKVFKVIYNAFCVLGCLLGAGFISGAEVITFFVRFGYWGVLGIVLASILFGVVIYKSISSAEEHQSVARFNFLPYCQTSIAGAMLSGIINVISQLLKIKYIIVLLCIAIFLFIAICSGIKVANAINTFVSIFALCILPIICNYIEINNLQIASTNSCLKASIFACLYVAMNSIACMPIIKNIKANKKQRIYIAVLTAFIMAALLSVVYAILVNKSFKTDMPILELVSSSELLKWAYIILLVVAMLSTLFSACSGAKKIFTKLDNNFLESMCTTMAVMTISFVGFGSIINYMYPVIGIALFVQYVLNKMYKQPKKSQKITQ